VNVVKDLLNLNSAPKCCV